MKNQKMPTKVSKTSSRNHHVLSSLNKTQHSFSCEKNKKDNYSSHIFENARNSLCCGSPRVATRMSNNDKYKSYMYFMQTGKITTNENVKRNSFAFQKRQTVTPTPRRNSLQHTQRKRLSVLSSFQANPQTQLAMTSRPKSQDAFYSKNHSKSQSMVTKKLHITNNLYVKGVKKSQNENNKQSRKKKSQKKLLFEKQKFKIQGKKCMQKSQKVNKKQNNKRTINIKQETLRSTIEADQKMEIQEQKLLAKLFKGIEFHRDLGRGAHALVKSAVDWNKNRKIAVKIYNRSLLKQQDIKNIERQVQILMSLNHENIVKLYEIVESYKTINLVMQYGGGNSLDQFIRSKTQGRLRQDEACKIFVQILKAAAYLQKMNVVHRDLKPQNILLNKHLQVKIIDFGFSLICRHDKEINSYCGTPTYMAPEVVSKTIHNPHLADRWSLGILLFTMLNGCCPFRAPTQKQLFEKINNGEFWYLSNISDEAKTLINSFLRKTPSERLSAQKALQTEWVKKNLVLENEDKKKQNS